MLVLSEDLKHISRDAVSSLDGLVAIGVDTERYW